ncbi:hypothetical protein [Arthrobacter sp. D2-10]
MAATADPRQLSPKVKAIPIVGALLFALCSGLAAITPDMLSALGPWAVPVGVVATTFAAWGLAYWRADPLRVDYFQQKAAHDAAEAEQAAVAANESAETTLTDEDDYKGKHVADPIEYDERG